MSTSVDNRTYERRVMERRRELTPGQKAHLGWMLSEERRKAERRVEERRTP